MGSIERWAKRRQSSGLSCWFTSGNIDAEFLQSGPEKSAWRDLLEEKGPGCHHIAFRTKNLTERTRYLEDKGHRLLQRGEFDSDKEVQPKQA
ncbi:VOC family protein [Rhizobium laguerreae]